MPILARRLAGLRFSLIATINREKNGRTQLGEAQPKTRHRRFGVAVIIRNSSADVHRRGGSRKTPPERGHVSGQVRVSPGAPPTDKSVFTGAAYQPPPETFLCHGPSAIHSHHSEGEFYTVSERIVPDSFAHPLARPDQPETDIQDFGLNFLKVLNTDI